MIEALLQAERLLVHGMIDQAEQIYANAVEQDPQNAIAMVGLARVALERSDDHLAYQRAVEALEIDPQNVAALRLEARLAEVFTSRGENIVRPASLAEPVVSATDAPLVEMPTEAPGALPSEAHVFARNPSMADHHAMEERRSEPARTDPVPLHEQTGQPPSRPRRRSLLRRLFGR